MDREPDSSGFNGWVNALYQDMSRSAVFNQFIISAEFEDICTEYGISSSVAAESTIEQFVSRFYEKCLNRSPDIEGLEGWVNALQNGNLTAKDLAEGFIFSQEFTSLNTTNEEFVTILYQVFMNREPDASGFNGWTNALYSYMTRLEIFNAFVISAEFSMTCDEYGINASEEATTANSAESFSPYISDSTDTITWRYRINNGQPIRPYLEGVYLSMQLNDLQLSINNKDLIRRGSLSGTISGEASGTVSAEFLEYLAPSNETTLITAQTINLNMTLSAYGETAEVDLYAATNFYEPLEWFLDRTDLDTLSYCTRYGMQGEIYGSLSEYVRISGTYNSYDSFSDTVTSADSWEIIDKLESYTVMGVTYHNVVVVDCHTKVPSLSYPYYPEDVTITYWVAKGIGLIKGIHTVSHKW